MNPWVLHIVLEACRPQRMLSVCSHTALALALLIPTANVARSQQFLEDAELVDFRIGSLSTKVGKLASGYGNLAGGGIYTFDRYFDSSFGDVRLTMLTPINRNFGILWGFGTGEWGNKYRIEPSIKLGFLAVEPVGKNANLSLSVSVVLGGYLREESCTADYGAIGGVQEVNCRLADSVLPPSETLKFLLDEPPGDQVSIALRYRWVF